MGKPRADMKFRFALFIVARLFESEPHLLRGFSRMASKKMPTNTLTKKRPAMEKPKPVLCIQPEGSRFNGEELHLTRNLDDGLMARCI